MQALVQIKAADQELLAKVDASMAEATQRSGDWVVCRAGCTPCCFGPFAISALDALRLQEGLAVLDAQDPARAEALRQRATAYVVSIANEYPGNSKTGELWDEDALPASFDDVPCPALDVATGLCDLYSSRPLTCRIFGAATRMSEGGIGACELCYDGATDEEIEACAVPVDAEDLEGKILQSLEGAGFHGTTIVAHALLSPGAG